MEAKQDKVALEDFEAEVFALSALRGVDAVPRMFHRGTVEIHNIALPRSVCSRPFFAYEHEPELCTVASIVNHGYINVVNSGKVEIGVKFALDVISQLTTAVREIQLRSVRHFDIHPSNVLLRGKMVEGEVRCEKLILIDFGKSSGQRNDDIVAPQLQDYMSRSLLMEVIRSKGLISLSFASSENGARSNYFAAGLTCTRLLHSVKNASTNSPLFVACQQMTTALSDERGLVENIASQVLTRCEEELSRRESARSVGIRVFQGENSVFDPSQIRLIDTVAVQRLRKVMQLGPTHFLYPGATHTRFVHTMGVTHLAKKYIDSAVNNDPDFLTATSERAAALLYATLHDVGHYPFAHYFEEFKADLSQELAQFVDHESLGEMIWQPGHSVTDNDLVETLEKVHKDFSKDWIDRNLGAKGNRNHVGRIVDGPMDCDKLDYLVRDAIACGVAYPKSIDIERLIGAVTRNTSARTLTDLGITAKGVASIEALLLARTQMYSEVYLHKSCRGMAACIKTALWLLARPSPSRNNAWMSGEEFVSAALGKNDSEFLIWMSHELHAKGGVEAEAAKLLIDKVFLTGERALYKRVRTLCALFPEHAHRDLKNLREDIDKMSFKQRNAAERRLEQLVCKKLKRQIPAYSLLLDAVHTRATDLPQLVRTAGGQAEKLTDVSPTIRALNGDDHQPRHNKVRLFAAPCVASCIREGLADHDIDDLLREAIK